MKSKVKVHFFLSGKSAGNLELGIVQKSQYHLIKFTIFVMLFFKVPS